MNRSMSINILQFDNNVYKYESYWRPSKDKIIYDSNNKPLPYPKEGTEWQNRQTFLYKLHQTQHDLGKKIIKYEEPKDCLLCQAKNITTGLFSLNNFRWENGLHHYIDIHKIKPSDDFIDYIFRYQLGNKRIISQHKLKRLNIKGITVVKENKRYLKIDRNQILIMDALMKHGSAKQYYGTTRNLKYSEHAGLLDFDNDGLERLIISGRTNRVDKYDDQIFQPSDMIDMYDYEYIFHTHPGSPGPGGRAKYGVLYEFPSIGDIFHFLDHYNYGDTQGSIVIAFEGMYIIRKLIMNNKKIKINEDNLYRELIKNKREIQKKAINNYGTDFSRQIFFEKIAQDKTYINELNLILNKYELNIDFYSRIKDSSGRWIIDTVYVPVFVVESK